MVNRGKDAAIHTERFRKPVILIPNLARCAARVELVVEIGIVDVEFPRRDADYGPVFLVQSDELEGVLSPKDDVVVELVPVAGSSDLATWSWIR
jgi:hypothetical protein